MADFDPHAYAKTGQSGSGPKASTGFDPNEYAKTGSAGGEFDPREYAAIGTNMQADTGFDPQVYAATGEGSLDRGKLAKLKDAAIKIGEAFNAVNAVAWAGAASMFGDEKFKDLYRKYQDEGSPVAAGVKKAMADMGITNKYAQMVGGILGDIAGDPLTYVSFGTLTPFGKAAKVAKGASELAGTGKRIAKINKVLAELAPEARKLAPTLAGQAELGQRALVQIAGRPAIRGGKVLKGLDVVADRTRPVRDLFKTGSKLKDVAERAKMDDILVEEKNLANAFEDLLKQKAKILNKEILKRIPKDEAKKIVSLAESPEMWARVKAGEFGDLGKLTEQFDDVLQLSEGLRMNDPAALEAVGAKNLAGKWQHEVPQLGANLPDELRATQPRYTPHAMPEEVRGAFRAAPGTSGLHAETAADELARGLLDKNGVSLSVAEVNKLAKQTPEAMIAAGIPQETAYKITNAVKAREEFLQQPNLLGFIKKRPEVADEFFSTNPGFLLKTNAERTGKAIGGARFRQAVGEGWGKTADQLSPQELSQWKKIDRFKGTPQGELLFPPDVADEVAQHVGQYFGDKPTNQIVDLFDKVQNYWKGWTLSPFLSYHNRNFGGAVWNNALAGMNKPSDIKYYTRAGKMQRGAQLLAKNAEEGKRYLQKIKFDNGMDGYEVLNLARQNGISGGNIYKAELVTGGVPKRNPFSLEGPVLRGGRALGTAVEDNVRLAHFAWAMDGGMDAADAAKSVMKYQFDYSDITPFEKNVMARLMPFYRFLRKNTPLQVQMAMQNPGKFGALEKTRKQINLAQGMTPEREVILQDYIASNVPVQIGTTKEGDPRMFALGQWFPTHSTMADLGHPFDKAMSMVTPAIKTPLEIAMNYDFFRKKPIEDVLRGRYTEPFANVPIPVKAKHVIKNVRILNEFDRLVGAGWSQIDPKTSNYILRTGAKPDLVDQLARLLTGVTLSPFKEGEAKRYRLLGIRKELTAIKGGAKSAARRGDKANVDASLQRLMELRNEAATLLGLEHMGQDQIDEMIDKAVSQIGDGE